MKKISKKILAFAISLAMVVSALASFTAKVDAATLTQDEIDSIAGSGTMTNMILGKAATISPGVAEGNAANLTNGSLTNGHCALSTGWGYSGEAYAIFDLGNYYKSESLDEIILAYKDMASNDTVVGRTYNIQYSIDQSNWETVYTSGTIAETDLQPDKCTIDDVSAYTGKVRYIKIDYPSLPTYGIQLTEIAVLATEPELAPMETCDDPAAVAASSVGIGKITINITAGPDQEDYHYSANLDNESGQLLKGDCAAGVDYTFDVPGGNHTVFVQSHKGQAVSTGINSNQVTVNTYETKVTDTDWNYAYGKTYTLDSGTSQEGSGSFTDGIISTSNYNTPSKGQAGSWATIDLGDTWKATSFETIAVWYRSLVGGTYPENGGVKFQYSTDGIDFTDVDTLTQAEFTEQRGTQQAPFRIIADVSGLTSGAVRYVRVYYPNSVAYGAQMSEIGVYDIDGDAELAPVETIDDPAGFTAASYDYNEITGTITAGPDQEDYTYSIYLNGNLAEEGLSAGSYTLDAVVGGTYDVSVKSYKDGFYSTGLTVSNVTVVNGYTYSSETGTGLYPDEDQNYGTNLITQDGATVTGVSATASSGNGTQAIDYNAGTRWETSASDPQWIKVDLGSVKGVKAIMAWWETANARDFKVELSSDDVTYRTVAAIQGASSGENRRDTIVLTSEASARYIRIYGTARTTGYGYSIWEMAVYGDDAPPGSHSVYIDGTLVGTVADGGLYTFPTSGMTEYSENSYYQTNDTSKAYAPGDHITVNDDLQFTGIDTVSVENGNGASIRMNKDNPGLSFKVTYNLNNSDPVMSSAFTYGALITTLDAYFDKYNENLIIDNSADQANVVVKSQSDWYSYKDGVVRPGIMKIRPYNITRDFVCRGYVKINYVSGQSKIIYATNPDGEGRVRSVTQVAISVKNTPSYYNTLSASEKEAVDYFAEQ